MTTPDVPPVDLTAEEREALRVASGWMRNRNVETVAESIVAARLAAERAEWAGRLAEAERERDHAQEHLAYHLRDYALNGEATGDLAVDMARWAGRLKERLDVAERALAQPAAANGEGER